MSAFANARKFFDACEAPKGWAGCEKYVADGAPFVAQSGPLSDVTTIRDYCEWMKGFGTVTAPGASYDLHSSSYDEDSRTAIFFATYHATHTGEGGPVPPTGKTTNSHYVYALTMDKNDKIGKMTKIWNASWALRELGWS
jgi:hypothetical protein